tara:strand:- start:5028 stop:5912 length:885 start_codon:yes stop_codon:yes gene_type:complete
MNCYLSSSLFRNETIEESIKKCGQLSNKFVEMSAPHPYQSDEEISLIFKKYKKLGFNFTLHNYFPPPKKSFVLNIASNDRDNIELNKDLVSRALNLSINAGSPVYAVHAGYLSKATAKDDGMFDFDDKEYSYSSALDRAVKFINNISNKFEKNKVKFLIENLFPSVARNSSLFCNYTQIKELIDQVPKNVGLLLDLGHLNISSNIMSFNRDEFLEKYLSNFSDRLHEIHISENAGLKDEHRALEKKSWQYEAIRKINSSIKNLNNEQIVYCLESRNANLNQISENLAKINNIIS